MSEVTRWRGGDAAGPARRPINTEWRIKTETQMTTFDDREKAFENKYAHDAEMQFKANARGNKKLGLWLAERFGLDAEEAQTYAGAVVAADLEEAGHEDVMRKVMADIAERKVELDEEAVRAKLAECHAEAKDELMNEAG